MSRPIAAAIAFAASGVALAAYPLLRPWGPETGADGAQTFAASSWVVAHTLAMVGFVALAVALRSLAAAPPRWWGGWPVRGAESRAWVAVALLLPYYGAEAFGLAAVGRHVVENGDVGVLDVADSFRFGAIEVMTFALGLVALASVGPRLAAGLWRTGPWGRAGGALACAGLLTYLPQFFAGAEVRVVHGVALGVGLVLVGASTWRANELPAVDDGGRPGYAPSRQAVSPGRSSASTIR